MANKWNLQSTIYRPNGNAVNLESKDSAIISNTTIGLESPFALPVKFIGICNLRYAPYKGLSRKIRCIFNSMVNKVVEFVLIKDLLMPRNIGDIIAGFITRLHSVYQTFSLFIRGQEFYLKCQFHAIIIHQLFEINKEGGCVSAAT
jgi:hypothetical protein